MDLSFANYVNLRTMKQLKELCRTLDLSQCGSRTELQKRVHTYATAVGYDRTGWAQFISAAVSAPETTHEATTFRCICLELEADIREATVKCTKCGLLQHKLCVKGCIGLDPYECPQCQIEQMDPSFPLYEFLSKPLKVPLTDTSAVNITLGAAALGYLRAEEGNCIIQLRSLKLDSKGYSHAWPSEAVATLNETRILDLQYSSTHSFRKRKDEFLELPLDLTRENHRISLWKRRDDNDYVYTVVLTRKRDINALLLECEKASSLCSKACKAYIASLFRSIPDLHLQRLSLRCPLTHLLIDIPVRGWRCKHIQCFDLRTYLLIMGETKVRRWQCPICREACCVLTVDRYMQRILAQARRNEECDMVEFRETGEYQLIENIPDHSSVSPRLRKAQKLQEPVLLDLKDSFNWVDFKEKVPEMLVFQCKAYQGIANFHKVIPNASLSEKKPEIKGFAGSLKAPIALD